MCEPSNEINPGVVYTFSDSIPLFDASTVDVKVGNDFRFRPFIAGSGIIIDETTNPGSITITSTNAPVGYTFSSLGGDVTLVGSLVGTDFRFRGISQGSNIILDNSNPNFITISSAIYTYSTFAVAQPSVSVVGTVLGNDFRFRPLIAGLGIGLDTITVPNGIIISSTIISDTYSTLLAAGVTSSVVATKVGNDFRFRGFIAGPNITLDQITNPNAIAISGAQYTFSDAAIGESIRNNLTGTNFSFRTLIPGNNISFDMITTPGAIIFNVPTPPIYTYSSNIVPGSDANITAPAVGNDFRFKPLNAGTNTTIEEITLPGAITINSIQPTYSSNVVAGSDANITATQVGNDFRFKPLNAGVGVTIEETTLPGAVTINAPPNVYTYSSNIVPGSDANITAAQVGNDFRFKPLNAGTNTTVEETTLPGAVTINGPTYSSNVVAGSDADITATQVGNDFRFKPLNGGNNITIDETTLPGAITFSTPTPPVYTYSSNVVAGSDADITAAQVGNDFRFKPLNAGTNTSIEETTLPGAVTINGPTYASNVIPGSDADITATQVGNQFRFKPLNAGTNTTIEETTLPGAVTINGPTYSSNVVAGSDANITDTQVGNDFRFKPLNAGTNTTIEETTLPGAVTINSIQPTYSSNIVAGSDANITAAQVGNDFRFKPLNAGTSITIEETTLPGAVTINAIVPVYTYSSNVVAGSDANITAAQVGNDFRFKPLNAGTSITIEETTLPGAVTINALPVPLPQNNILYVDEVFGNNTTAVRERLDRPYQTLSAALSASLANDLIYVLPGNYTGVNLTISTNINFHLSGGVTITGTAGLNVFTINAGVTFGLYGDGVISNNLTISNAGTSTIIAKTISGQVTLVGSSLMMKVSNFTTASVTAATGAVSLDLEASNITTTATLFTFTQVANITCNADNITCNALLSFNSTSCNIKINARTISCTNNVAVRNLLITDSTPAAGRSTCFVEVNCVNFSSTNGGVLSITSSKTLVENMPIAAFNFVNMTVTSTAVTSLSLSTNGYVKMNGNRLNYSNTGTYTLFNGHVEIRLNNLINTGALISTGMTLSSSAIININSASLSGTFTSGNYTFGTLVGTNFSFTGTVNVNITTANIVNTTSSFFNGSSVTQFYKINELTLNTNTVGALTTSTVHIDAGRLIMSGTGKVFTNTGGSLHIRASYINNMIFTSTAITRIYFDVDHYELTGISTELGFSNGLVHAKIKRLDITGMNLITDSQADLEIDQMTVSATASTSSVIVYTNSTQATINIKKLFFNANARSFINNTAQLTMNIDSVIISQLNATTSFIESSALIRDTYNFNYVQTASVIANSIFFRRSGVAGITTVNINSLTTDVVNNYLALFNNTTSGPILNINISYARIFAILLRCAADNTTTFLQGGRIECVSNNSLITNLGASNTIEFGGNLKTAGTNILTNTGTLANINILPSKLVSTGNCISSTTLTTMFFAPTVTKNGVSILQVNVVPAGNLTVAAAMN